MPPRIKICGVTRADNAAGIAALGADYLGLNFWPRSKRYLSVAAAPAVAAAARAHGNAQLVGVFVDPSDEDLTAALAAVPLDAIQLHGSESPARVARVAALAQLPVWKALAVGSAADLADLSTWSAAAALLLDAPSPHRGGSGVAFDWQLAAAARARTPHIHFILAGGLRAETVADAVRAASPWAVDVASGVESAPGIKDLDKVTAFLAAARARS